MSVLTLERPQESKNHSNFDVFHYVRKENIALSAVEGVPVKALCGAQFPVTKAPKVGSPVCHDCQEVYENLPK